MWHSSDADTTPCFPCIAKNDDPQEKDKLQETFLGKFRPDIVTLRKLRSSLFLVYCKVLGCEEILLDTQNKYYVLLCWCYAM